MNRFLTEALRKGDMKFLIVDTIEVDRYISKFDDEKFIVVTFKVMDKKASDDLCEFISIGCVNEIFSVDKVSFFDYEDNAYKVHVEMERNLHFPEKLLNMLEKLSYLGDIESWYMIVGNLKRAVKVTKTSIKKFVNLGKNPQSAKLVENICESLGIRSYHENIIFHKTFLELVWVGSRKDFNYYLTGFLKECRPLVLNENRLFSSFHHIYDIIEYEDIIILQEKNPHGWVFVLEKHNLKDEG